MTEKLLKTFEVLRGHYNQVNASSQSSGSRDSSPVSQRKKDLLITSKERINLCTTIADFLPFQSIREAQTFPTLLTVSVELLLQACDDADADVRLMAGEALNRIIKSLLESNVGRVQVELYKEIKKNGAARSLKAAIQRFAETCHMIRPQKCRPYLANLLPCIVKIAKRTEDQLQEVLGILMSKLCPVLGKFMREVDIKILLKSFVPNLKSESAMTRRTSAAALNHICLNSRNPSRFYAWLLNILLGLVVPLTDSLAPATLLGVLLCFRHVIPNVGEADEREQTMKGSFGEKTPASGEKGSVSEMIDQSKLLKVYEVTMFCTKHSDHNVVNAALEVSSQILQSRPHCLMDVLLSPQGISPTVTNATAGIGITLGSDLHLDILGSDTTDSGLEEETQSISDTKLRENLSELSMEASSKDSAFGDISEVSGTMSADPRSEKSTDSENSSIDQGEEEGENEGENEDQGLSLPSSYTDGGFVNIDEKDVDRARRFASVSSVSDIPENENEEVDLADLERMMSITSYDAEEAIERYFNIDAIACSGLPILHCVRLMCSFLLAGKAGKMLPDSLTRVSVKSLALNCLSHALAIYPGAFLARVMPEEAEKVIEDESDSERSEQCVRDCLLFAEHTDPQIRGMVANIAGLFLKAALCESGGRYKDWAISMSQKYATDELQLEDLIELLKRNLDDESSISLKMTCSSVKGFINELFESNYSNYAYEIILKILILKDNSYWLLKVEVLELLASLDYRLVNLAENKYLTENHKEIFSGYRISGIQNRSVEAALSLLADEDVRVRQAASKTIVDMIAHLDFGGYKSKSSPQRILQLKDVRGMITNSVKTNEVVSHFRKYKSMFTANLSFIIRKILNKLNYATTKYLMHGCCQALALLAETYPVSLAPLAWELYPQCKVSVQNVSKERGIRALGPMRKLVFEDEVSSFAGPLCVAMSLLTSSWVTLDLQAHQELLKLCVNILCGSAAAVVRQTAQERKESGMTEDDETFGTMKDERWPVFKDPILNAVSSKLFHHTVRLLCICMHVIEQTNPASSSSKLQINFPGKDKERSLSTVASPSPVSSAGSSPQLASTTPGTTSPRKFLLNKSLHRRAHSDQSAIPSADKSASRKNSDGTNPQGTPDSKPSQEAPQSTPDKSEKLGHFHTVPHMLKLYDVAKGAYKTYQVTSVSKKGEKFTSFLRGVLEAFSLQLELASFSEVGTTAEEFLEYLMSCVKIDAERSFLAVQQLLKSLFGTNVASQPEMYHLPHSTKHLVETRGDPTFSLNAGSESSKSEDCQCEDEPLFETLIKKPCDLFEESLQGGRPVEVESTDIARKARSSTLNFFKKFKKIAAPQKPVSKLSKEKLSTIQSYIRLFEPLVIHALKTYTMTSNLEVQAQVIHLLDQLIRLRVNYSLLDADQIFIAFVLKQFEFVEAGQIGDPASFIPDIFQFLVLLSYECFQPKYSQAKAIIVMPQIIQLCDGIMACGQPANTHAIPALKPVVHDLFISKNQARADSPKELDTQREVAFTMLLRLTQYPEVLEMMSMVLEGSKEDDEKWKRFSRQIVDVVFPQLPKLQIHLDDYSNIDILNHLFDSLAPIALRPADVILKALFSSVQITSLREAVRWLCMVLSLGRILITQNNEDIMLTRILQLGICKQCPSNLIHTLADTRESHATDSDDTTFHQDQKSDFGAAEFYANYFFYAVKIACGELVRYSYSTICDGDCLKSLEKLTLKLLVMFSTILKSERFKDIALAASNLIQQWNGTANATTQETTLREISHNLCSLKQLCPSLLLHWCHVLQLLGFQDHNWWRNLYGFVGLSHGEPKKENWTGEITRKGVLLLYASLLAECYEKQTDKDVSLLCSLLKTNMDDVISLSVEDPMRKLLSIVYEDSDFSGLFLQYIVQICELKPNDRKYLEQKSVLEILGKLHPNQSSFVLQFMLTNLPFIRSYGVARYAETLTCKRLEYMQTLPANERLKQLPDKELHAFITDERNTKKFPRLITLINKILSKCQHGESESRLRSLSHPLDNANLGLEEYTANKDWFVSFVKKICLRSKKRDVEDLSCAALLLTSLDVDSLSDVLSDSDLELDLFHSCLTIAIKAALDKKSSYLEELTQSIEMSGSPEAHNNQRMLFACKGFLLKQVNVAIKSCTTEKQVNRVSFVEDQVFPTNSESPQGLQGLQKFILVNTDTVRKLCDDKIWRENMISICKCVREFLAPSCYWNKHWKLNREDLVSFMEFAFVALKGCLISSNIKTSSFFSDLHACLECLSLVLHSREFWSTLTQELFAQLLAHGINDVYNIVSAVTLNPGEALAKEISSCQEHTPFAEDASMYTRCCHRVSEMVHTLRTHFSFSSPGDSTLPLSIVLSLRRVIIGLARLPLVNSFVRVPPIVWKLGWQLTLEGSFKTELPPLPVEILKEKDVLKEFIFRANAVGWTSRAQFEETWAALLGVLSSPPMADDTTVEDDIEAAQSSCLAVHCITSLVLDTTLAPVPGNPGVSRYSMIPRQKEYPFLGSRAGKRLSIIRKTIETEYKEECNLSTNQPPFSSHQFLYPVVPSLIFEKQRKQVLQRGCFMVERLYSSNLENGQCSAKYTLGQISASAIRTRLVSSDVQEDSDSDDSEALIIQINEEDPRKRFQELDIRSCLQFLLELFEQWLSPFVVPKTPLMLKTEAVKSLCLLSDLLLEMSHFEWILGVLLEFYQNNPIEDDITAEYIVPTICKALAVLKVEGGIAERICRILESALKSPHVPLQISALEGGLYLLESHVPSTNMTLVPILTDYLTKHIMSPVDAIQVLSQRFCAFVWSTAFYIMETCSTEIQDITFTSIVIETCIALLSSNEAQVPAAVARLLFRGLERLVVSFTIVRSTCDRLAKMAQNCLQSDNPDRMVSALGLLCTCMYTGKEGQQNTGLPDNREPQSLPIADSQLVMMERLGVLFNRMRKGTASEATLVAKILPSMLLDFLPIQEVMNKIFSEFLSSQQPHPELIAKVAFEVFDELHRQGQQDAVRNWIILSLGSFVQRTPLAMAIWSLNCFLISGTMNPWLQSLFPYILSRKGKLDEEDRRIFCMLALDFYQNQIIEPEEKRMFLSTFQRKSPEIAAYRELVECCLRADTEKIPEEP